jgi:hypothetical protein
MNDYTRGRLGRRGAAGIVAGALATGGLLALSAPAAQAQATPLTVTFSTPGHAEWTVPAGVSSVFVTAYGGQGSSGDPQLGSYGQGGLAAKVSAQVAVAPGQQLDLTVAGAGHGATGGTPGGGGAGGPGAVPGAGGGGATWLTTTGFPLIVAAGGGGAASFGNNGGSSAQPGEAGSALSDGAAGGVSINRGVAPGGSGGSSGGISPSCSLALAGPAGSPAIGSPGGDGGGRDENGFVPRSGGGGGGGGYVGGGGGGGGAYCAADGTFRSGSGGGGGGGSSFVRGTLTDTSILQGVGTGDGAITITYEGSVPTFRAQASPAPNAAGWNNSEVTVHWNWTDTGGSGLDPQSCSPASTSGGRTGRVVLQTNCSDRVGNVTTGHYAVNIDTAAPAAHATTRAPKVRGWSRGPVSITWNWVDTVSGLDTASGLGTDTCPSTSRVARQGTHTTKVTCQDVAGNVATATQVTKIDRTAPRIKVQRPVHRTYHRGQHVLVKYHCRDAGVGVATCQGSVAQRHALPTEKLGQHAFRVTAKDRLGNTRTVWKHYRVVR